MVSGKVSVFPTITTINGDELVHLIDNPGGTPANTTDTVDAFLNYMLGRVQTWTANNTFANIIHTGRHQYDKGVDVVAADAPTLGGDGNVFDITGVTTINHIQNTGWQIGSEIILHFTAATPLNHATGTETGDEASLYLNGDTNYTTTAGDIITFVLLEATQWQETSRNSGSGGGEVTTWTVDHNAADFDLLQVDNITSGANNIHNWDIARDAAITDSTTIGKLRFRAHSGVGVAPVLDTYCEIEGLVRDETDATEDATMFFRCYDSGSMVDFITLNLNQQGFVTISSPAGLEFTNGTTIKGWNSIQSEGTPATAGTIRLNLGESINWRNAGDTGNLGILITSDEFNFASTTEVFGAKIVTNHPTLATADSAADFLLIHDATDGLVKKILPDNLGVARKNINNLFSAVQTIDVGAINSNLTLGGNNDLIDGGIIGNISFNAKEDVGGAPIEGTYARINVAMVDDSPATEDGSFSFDVYDSGTLRPFYTINDNADGGHSFFTTTGIERFRIESAGVGVPSNSVMAFDTLNISIAKQTIVGDVGGLIFSVDSGDTYDFNITGTGNIMSIAATGVQFQIGLNINNTAITNVTNINFGAGQSITSDAGGFTYTIPAIDTHDFNITGTGTVFRIGTPVAELAAISLTGSLFQKEKAAGDVDVATYGQFWTRDDAPGQTPMWTGDDGIDVDLSTGTEVTTWTADHDAASFDLRAISNLEFEPTTGLPASTATYIVENPTNVLLLNVPDAGAVVMKINGASHFIMDATGLSMNGFNLENVGQLQGDDTGMTITSNVTSWNYSVSAGGSHVWEVNGGTELTLSAAALTLSAGNNLITSASGALGYIDLDEITTPASATALHGRLYTKLVTDHAELFYKDELGTETNLIASGAGDMVLATAQVSTGKKTFGPDATLAGLNVRTIGVLAPSGPVEGDIWYNDTDEELNYTHSGGNAVIATEQTPQTFVNKTMDFNNNTITNIDNTMVKLGAGIAFNKLEGLVSGRIIVGSVGSVMEGVVMSGDVGIVAGGLTTITNVPVGALPATVVLNDQANTYTAGSKQTFAHSATTAGFNVGLKATSDPSAPVDGDMWYLDVGTDALKYRINGSTRIIADETNAITFTNKVFGGGNLFAGAIPMSEIAGTTVGAGQGHIWTRNTAPSRGMFTDDADTDFAISGYSTINFVIDGGGSAITTGIKGQLVVDFDCVVVEWAIIGLPAGAIVVDVSRSTFAGFPTTTTLSATEKPTIVATNDTGEDRALTTWSAINAGDILEFEVDSVATIQRCTVALKVRRT